MSKTKVQTAWNKYVSVFTHAKTFTVHKGNITLGVFAEIVSVDEVNKSGNVCSCVGYGFDEPEKNTLQGIIIIIVILESNITCFIFVDTT